MRRDLVEKQNSLIKRADDMLNKAKEEKRELTPDEMEEIAEIRDDVRRIKKALGLEDDINKLKDKEQKMDDTPLEEALDDERACGSDKMAKRALEVEEEQAFENYVRGRVIHERAGELTPAANSGGSLIPTTIANRIIKTVYNICPILEKSEKFNIKGKLDLPFYDVSTSTINVAYAEEFTPLTSSNGKFDKIQLDGFLAGALSKISRSLINNSQFNIVDFVVKEMAYAIKRFIEKELLVGTSGKVTGLSTLTNGLTTASATAITADEVVQLHDKIIDEYQNGAIWIMSPSTRTALRTLKSTTGYYLLNDDVSTPFGTTLLGKPVYVSDNMPNIGAGNVAIYYGDMSGLATKFSEDINIQVLRERFADEHADAVIGWFEFDAKVQNAQKIAKLTCKSN